MEKKSDNKPYDTAFKDLAEQEPEALLRLIGALPHDAVVRLLPREVSSPALAADQPFEVTSPTEHFLAHAEAQTRWRDDVPARMVEYEAVFWVNYRLPVRSYVLVFIPDGMPDEVPTTCTIEADHLTLTGRFTVIELWELSAKDALAMKHEGLLPFIPLMNGGRAEVEQSARALGQITDDARKRELALHFVMLASLRYNRTDIYDILGRLTMIPIHALRESSMYQFILDEGRQEGRQEGKRSAVIEMLQRFAAKRFPELEIAEDVNRVEDIAALEQLCLEINELPDAEALRVRLLELAASKQA